MKCDKCNAPIPEGDRHRHQGMLLCEDCYMIALSPVKTCDPWAVHAARNMTGSDTVLTKPQREILAILKETGGIEFDPLAERVGLTPDDLQREIAALRHMEKLRAAKVEDKKIFRLW